MSDPYRETLRTYDKIASAYADAFMELPIYDGSYALFCEALQAPDARLLELGCGPGNVTRALLRRKPRLRITATDAAPAMLKLARQHCPGVETRQLDCRDLHALEAVFDGVVAGFVLPYLSATDAEKLIADCRARLREGGLLYLSFVPGDPENSGWISGSTGDRTYFYYHEPAVLRALLERQGFEMIHEVEVPFERKGGSMEKHLIFIARSGKTA